MNSKHTTKSLFDEALTAVEALSTRSLPRNGNSLEVKPSMIGSDSYGWESVQKVPVSWFKTESQKNETRGNNRGSSTFQFFSTASPRLGIMESMERERTLFSWSAIGTLLRPFLRGRHYLMKRCVSLLFLTILCVSVSAETVRRGNLFQQLMFLTGVPLNEMFYRAVLNILYL